MEEKILQFLEAIDARLIEINAHLVYLCHIEEEKMKREPSAFSYVKDLEVGDVATVPYEKLYAVTCAVSYLFAEYERTFDVSPDPASGTIKVTRTQ